jgi:hypothetical protein
MPPVKPLHTTRPVESVLMWYGSPGYRVQTLPRPTQWSDRQAFYRCYRRRPEGQRVPLAGLSCFPDGIPIRRESDRRVGPAGAATKARLSQHPRRRVPWAAALLPRAT